MTVLTATEKKQIDSATAFYESKRNLFETFAKSIVLAVEQHPELPKYTHFLKYRTKDVEHLRNKLVRKVIEGKQSGELIVFGEDNLFQKINDLAGVRLIHLHTEQMRHIHRHLKDVFLEQQYRVIEEATANCWDVEYESIYKQLGITTKSRESMYTTVHYVVESNQRTKITCEIQVRTLMDEVWGEVSHRVNYPEPSANDTCRDQLKILARLTTGCTRLVDSIFRAHEG
jgi:ppGpp synthetase/RelA/SpoT-type nucleotidyltranferase